MFDEHSRVLITGGTGSFGKAFLKKVLSTYPNIERLVVFSRDELKQWELQQKFPPSIYPQLRYFIGDIRDRDRLKRALRHIDTVVHAAALKQVPAAEYNPMEFIKTNVIGAQNLIEACLDTDVRSLVALSTDKAAAPINLYGATKLCSDKLFIAANQYAGGSKSGGLNCSVVRYGNVMGSRGSVIPFFISQVKSGVLTITDPRMTRFNITLEEGVNMVLWALKNSKGSEIFIPKIPSYRIMDVANAIGPNCKKSIVGIRPGEKVYEEMITISDSYSTLDLGETYAILPSGKFSSKNDIDSIDSYLKATNAKMVEKDFSYNSEDNDRFLNINEIRSLIKQNIDNNFPLDDENIGSYLSK